jgi:hypothetical protein
MLTSCKAPWMGMGTEKKENHVWQRETLKVTYCSCVLGRPNDISMF